MYIRNQPRTGVRNDEFRLAMWHQKKINIFHFKFSSEKLDLVDVSLVRETQKCFSF